MKSLLVLAALLSANAFAQSASRIISGRSVDSASRRAARADPRTVAECAELPGEAHPYPTLPDALVLENGKRVTTAKDWWEARRAQIVEAFDREVYGRVPENLPACVGEVVATTQEKIGATPAATKHLLGHVDNAALHGHDQHRTERHRLPRATRRPCPS